MKYFDQGLGVTVIKKTIEKKPLKKKIRPRVRFMGNSDCKNLKTSKRLKVSPCKSDLSCKIF